MMRPRLTKRSGTEPTNSKGSHGSSSARLHCTSRYPLSYATRSYFRRIFLLEKLLKLWSPIATGQTAISTGKRVSASLERTSGMPTMPTCNATARTWTAALLFNRIFKNAIVLFGSDDEASVRSKELTGKKQQRLAPVIHIEVGGKHPLQQVLVVAPCHRLPRRGQCVGGLPRQPIAWQRIEFHSIRSDAARQWTPRPRPAGESLAWHKLQKIKPKLAAYIDVVDHHPVLAQFPVPY